jgi:flagellar hook-associated protein 2
MVTQITLGNAFDQNGRIIVGGGQSGFDTKSLVESLATAKRQPAVTLEKANKTIDSQLEAFTTLKTTLGALKSAVDTLRNPPGVGNSSQNVFSYRTASLTSSSSVAASNYVSVSVQPGANVQNITIDEIHQLAQQTKQQSGVFTLADTTTASAVASSATAGMFTAGTFVLNALDGGSDKSITLTAGDSLQSVVNKFNAVSSNTGIQATIVNVSTGNYKIIFSGTKTGVANGFDLTSGTTVVSGSSALAQIGLAVPTQLAQNAQFTLDGVDIERSTNSVSDLISGVTFNLTQATPGGTTISAVIAPDTSIIKNAITGFADAYNQFRLFNSTQTKLNSDGTPAEKSVLAQNSTLRSVAAQLSSEVNRAVAGLSASTNEQKSGTLTLTDVSSASAVSSTPTAGSFSAGTVTLNATDGGADPTITLVTGDSLQTVVNKFNAVTSRTSITASILQTGSGAYQVVFKGPESGFDLNSVSTVVSDPSGALSLIGFSDTTISKSLTSVGISFSDFAGDSTNPATSNIMNIDTEALASALSTDFTTVQKLFQFNLASDNTALASYSRTNALAVSNFSLSIDRSSDVRADKYLQYIASSAATDGERTVLATAINTLLGSNLTPALTSTSFATSTAAFVAALAAQYPSVTDKMTAFITDLKAQMGTNYPLGRYDILDRAAGNYVATYTDAAGATQTTNIDAAAISSTGSDVILTGKTGTVLEGLKMIFASAATNPASINVSITQGIGDRVFNALDSFLNTTDGMITNAVADLTKKENANKTAIEKIDAQIVTYRDEITNTYAQLEAALSKANNLLQLLDSQQKARSQD